jgi:hypothetical protein
LPGDNKVDPLIDVVSAFHSPGNQQIKRRKKVKAMRQKVLADIKNQKGKALEKHVWNKAGKNCPFKTNRGFSFNDENCLECPERAQCKLDTQRRLLSILHGFQNTLTVWEDSELYEQITEGEYLEAGRKLDAEWFWFNEKRQSIRQAANSIIDAHANPKDCIHPNTRRYFQNCFPKWNTYEQEWIENVLHEKMENFHIQDRSFSWRYNYLPADYELDENYNGVNAEYLDPDEGGALREEELISRGDWRGFPFDNLFNDDDNIPAKTRKQFAQDYFSYKQRALNAEKETAKRLGLFGKQKKTEKWPRMWMMANKRIKQFIESKKGQFFIELLKYLESNRMKMQEGEQIAKKLKHGGKKFVCVQVDREKTSLYLSRRQELRGIVVSVDKVHRFLKWMDDYKLIIKLGQPGSRANSVYAIGKWFAFPDPITREMKPGGIRSFVQENNKKALIEAIKVKL